MGGFCIFEAAWLKEKKTHQQIDKSQVQRDGRFSVFKFSLSYTGPASVDTWDWVAGWGYDGNTHKTVVLCPREQHDKYIQISQQDDVLYLPSRSHYSKYLRFIMFSFTSKWFCLVQAQKDLVRLKVQSEEFLTTTTNMTTVEDVLRMYLPS